MSVQCKADGQASFRAPMNNNETTESCGLIHVGVRKSSGFCVISSYFQLPISIAIQPARPTAHNRSGNGRPSSLSTIFLFLSFTLLSFSSLLTLSHSQLIP